MEIAFFACCTYVVVETIMLPIAGLRGREVRGRVITYLVVLLAAVFLGLILLGQTRTVIT